MKSYQYLSLSLSIVTVLTACSGGTGAGSGTLVPQAAAQRTQTTAPTVAPACQRTMMVGDAICQAIIRTDIAGGRAGGYHGPDFRRAEAEVRSEVGNHDFPYTPADLQSAYDVPSSSAGSGQVIGEVAAYDDPRAEADMNAYRRHFGIPACTSISGCFRKINVAGKSAPLPAPSIGWGATIAADLEMMSAVCPRCHIVLVEASSQSLLTNNGLGAAVDTAVRSGAKYINNSYVEFPKNPKATNPYYDGHPGVVITAAAGDYGYLGSNNVFPAAYAHVVAVGITSLYANANSPRGWGEIATSGTSACSTLVPRPSWETSECASSGFDGRVIPDISAVGNPYTGVWTYMTYPYLGWAILGGSTASPIITAAYALAGNAATAGPGATSIWQAGKTHSKGLNDITVGANLPLTYINKTCDSPNFAKLPLVLCLAGIGWDGPTGWGSPNGISAL